MEKWLVHYFRNGKKAFSQYRIAPNREYLEEALEEQGIPYKIIKRVM